MRSDHPILSTILPLLSERNVTRLIYIHFTILIFVRATSVGAHASRRTWSNMQRFVRLTDNSVHIRGDFPTLHSRGSWHDRTLRGRNLLPLRRGIGRWKILILKLAKMKTAMLTPPTRSSDIFCQSICFPTFEYAASEL